MYIPPGFSTVTPYFVVKDAHGFINFLIQGLGGLELLRHTSPDGRIMNSQIRIGTTTFMVGEASAPYPAVSGHFYLYVEDAHASVKRALDCGASLERAVADMPYGDRQGGVRDATGNIWWISQRLVEEPYSV
jgi:PhnB protein